MSKHDVIIQSVESLKNSQHGTTAVKVEFEANIGRRNSYGDGECNNGYRTCEECYGDWEGTRCEDECDEGRVSCDTCEGSGELAVLDDDGNDTTEMRSCEDCEHDGYDWCTECSNEGYYSDCDNCEEGSVECWECDGNGCGGSGYGSTKVCHEYIMEKLSHLGLAEYKEDDELCLSHDIYTNWHPIAPLMYAEFYNDGSVDSELTVTVAIDNPENVYLLPKISDIFKEFCRVAGSVFDTRGAGMHMALINTRDCTYPSSSTELDYVMFRNFRKSMGLLLPALYFLGSSDDKSRGLNYRRPEIGDCSHRSAIDFRGGAVEFRIFNTCYDNPEAILDNLVVMSNAMKFWSEKYRKHGLAKITNRVQFGTEGSDKLDRFYVTYEHLDLLNNGLNILKPSYYTIRELKSQRGFKTTKAHIKNRVVKIEKESEVEYREYENRYTWNIEVRRNRIRSELIESHLRGTSNETRLAQSPDEVIKEIEPDVNRLVTEYAEGMKSLKAYVDERVNKLTRDVGDYTLTA